VTRKLSIVLCFSIFAALPARPQAPVQNNAPQTDKSPGISGQKPPEEDLPPEEDETEAPEHYSFNPIKAKQVFEVGNFYWKKGKYKGAAQRFLEATRWNPGWADAYFRLGEAELKLRNKTEAQKAFNRVMQIAPNSKQAREAQKLMAKAE
jgi:tetratricopeptide (TPR) repeat protein